MEHTSLTTEEEREFTPFNASAYDLCRLTGQQTESIPPCWLVMSAEAKAECRTKLCAHLREKLPLEFRGKSDGFIEMDINMMATLRPLVQRWREAELVYKRARAEGNPRAFFAD